MPEYAYDPRLAKIEDTYYVIWCRDFYGASIGGATLDKEDPGKVLYRCGTFLLTPEKWYEERKWILAYPIVVHCHLESRSCSF